MKTNILFNSIDATNKTLQATNSETLIIILSFLGIVAFIALIFILIFVIFLIRRLNIIAQKVDYLVEDITYKVEALTPTVDIINKVSNYAISADVITNRSIANFYKILKNNQTSLLKLFQSILSQFNNFWEAKKTDKNKNKAEKEFEDGETIVVDPDFSDQEIVDDETDVSGTKTNANQSDEAMQNPEIKPKGKRPKTMRRKPSSKPDSSVTIDDEESSIGK